jgi:hypothetical protein
MVILKQFNLKPQLVSVCRTGKRELAKFMLSHDRVNPLLSVGHILSHLNEEMVQIMLRNPNCRLDGDPAIVKNLLWEAVHQCKSAALLAILQDSRVYIPEHLVPEIIFLYRKLSDVNSCIVLAYYYAQCKGMDDSKSRTIFARWCTKIICREMQLTLPKDTAGYWQMFDPLFSYFIEQIDVIQQTILAHIYRPSSGILFDAARRSFENPGI